MATYLIPIDGPLAKVTLSSWDDTVRLDRVEVKLERASVNDVREAAKENPQGARELTEYLAKKANVKIPWAAETSTQVEASEQPYKRNRIGFGARS